MRTVERELLHCPACQRRELRTRALACPDCEIEIRADVVDNEFSRLSGDDLHFLRVFIHCEGKIKDVEKALGISYPSVKGRLQGLKERLMSEARSGPVPDDPVRPERAELEDAPPVADSRVILEKIQSGEIPYEAGLELLRQLKTRG